MERWLSEEALQIAEEKVKQKAKEKGKNIAKWMQSSREYQGEVKKVLWNEQCKEIKEDSKMKKTRNRFKKIGYQENTSCKNGHSEGQKQ